jgi:hypothetical protein
MAAAIVSTSSPYTMQTGRDGSFEFEDVNAGTYTLKAYAGGKWIEQQVVVASDVTRVDVGEGR